MQGKPGSHAVCTDRSRLDANATHRYAQAAEVTPLDITLSMAQKAERQCKAAVAMALSRGSSIGALLKRRPQR